MHFDLHIIFLDNNSLSYITRTVSTCFISNPGLFVFQNKQTIKTNPNKQTNKKRQKENKIINDRNIHDASVPANHVSWLKHKVIWTFIYGIYEN